MSLTRAFNWLDPMDSEAIRVGESDYKVLTIRRRVACKSTMLATEDTKGQRETRPRYMGGQQCPPHTRKQTRGPLSCPLGVDRATNFSIPHIRKSGDVWAPTHS